MTHIFISHKRVDGGETADALVAALETEGRRCWVAPRDVKAGTYQGQIVSAIEKCCGLVLLLTPGANESQDVLDEVQIAREERKLIVPVIVRETRPSNNLRYHMASLQRVPWTEPKAVAKLLAGVFRAPVGPEVAKALAEALTAPVTQVAPVDRHPAKVLAEALAARPTSDSDQLPTSPGQGARPGGQANTPKRTPSTERAASRTVTVQMDDMIPPLCSGRVRTLYVKPSDSIQRGGALISFELEVGPVQRMPFDFRSPVSGVIESVEVSVGDKILRETVIAIVCVSDAT
jgi:hypothetical protein